jgi:hypothetical protein
MLKTSTGTHLTRIAVFCTLCLILTGCGNKKVTKDNFDKIKNDMTLQEVQDILGEGTRQGDGSNMGAQVGVDVTGGAGPSSTTDYVWENKDKSITVTFNKQNKVIGKRNSGL